MVSFSPECFWQFAPLFKLQWKCIIDLISCLGPGQPLPGKHRHVDCRVALVSVFFMYSCAGVCIMCLFLYLCRGISEVFRGLGKGVAGKDGEFGPRLFGHNSKIIEARAQRINRINYSSQTQNALPSCWGYGHADKRRGKCRLQFRYGQAPRRRASARQRHRYGKLAVGLLYSKCYFSKCYCRRAKQWCQHIQESAFKKKNWTGKANDALLKPKPRLKPKTGATRHSTAEGPKDSVRNERSGKHFQHV